MSKTRFLLTGLIVVVLLAAVGTAVAASGNYRAHLSNDEEVFTVPVVSDAQGQALFQLSEDGAALDYKLIVSNIQNTRMAHIHQGAPGVNGPIIVWLYPDAPPFQLIPGRHDGILAEGAITASSLVGPMAGQTLADLVALIEAGNAYVNVHTDQYPGGEVRGQVH